MRFSTSFIKAAGLLFLCIWVSARWFDSSLVHAEKPAQETILRVAIKDIEPFVFIKGEQISGFSIDLWEEIALLTDFPFEFIVVESVEDQLDSVINGEADIAIAAISMTPEREELIDFSYPYFLAGLQIMAVEKPASTLDRLFGFFFTSRFLWGLAGLLLILIIIGHIVWLLEHKTNPDFPSSYWKGIWEGLWWASVTVTTVGYGDKRVNDKWGRILAIFWMFAGLFLIANFTAFVTAEATVSRLETSINDFQDLPGKRVATVSGTTSAEYLRDEGIPFRAVGNVEIAYSLLENGLTDAIVYDAPVLQYYLTTVTNDNEDFILVGSSFKLDDYGIAMPHNSPYKEDINKALLEIKESGRYEVLTQKWGLNAE